MTLIAFLLLTAVSGLIIGALGRLVVPGPDPMSLGQTVLVGLAASVAAGLVSLLLFDDPGGGGFVLSVAIAGLFVYLIRRGRARGRGLA